MKLQFFALVCLAPSIGGCVIYMDHLDNGDQAPPPMQTLPGDDLHTPAPPFGEGVGFPEPPLWDRGDYSFFRATYEPGGYVLTFREDVGLTRFWQVLDDQLTDPTKDTTPIDYSMEERVIAALPIMDGTIDTESRNPARRGEVAFTAVPTPSGATMALLAIETILDDLMNRLNATISSALFSMRAHVSATISDLNVVFRNNMNTAFDKLTTEQQKILTQAYVLAAQAQQTVDKVQQDGYESAADLVCQTSADLANYSIGLPTGRLVPPDILCLKQQKVVDVGPQHEDLLTFRGVNLLPRGVYPEVSITVANQAVRTVSGGGNAIMQVPIPGGLNGAPNDTSLRGIRVAQAEFNWPGINATRRWLFALHPYSVRQIWIDFKPLIEGPVRGQRQQRCEVDAPGGDWSANERFATCTINADSGWEIEDCVEGSTYSQNGDSQIVNKLQSLGSCTWELRAKSKGQFGAGAWLRFWGIAKQKKLVRMYGKPLTDYRIVNQGPAQVAFTYPKSSYIPPEYVALAGQWTWQVHYADNRGREVTLTPRVPSNSAIGVIGADDGSGVLTVSFAARRLWTPPPRKRRKHNHRR